MAAPSPPSPNAVSLADQADELEKIVRERERFWPDQVARGRLKPETAEAKIAAVRAAAASMRWLERNAGWIKCQAEQRRLLAIEEAQARDAIVASRATEIPADDAREDPAIAECLRHFPDAELGAVTPLHLDATPDPDQPSDHAHEEAA